MSKTTLTKTEGANPRSSPLTGSGRIDDRIRKAYRKGITYYELMAAVFPRDKYPKAWEYSANGGPPGCAMAFGAALNRMGAWIGPRDKGRVISLPNAESRDAANG